MHRVAWRRGSWTHPPIAAVEDGSALVVEGAPLSDAWRITAYGFVHDSEHALLQTFSNGSAVEVTFVCDLVEQFDQAGVFVRVDDATWIKAGVEFADGQPHLGAVVTHGVSDWSVAPVPTWLGRAVTIRASRRGDAVTIRARVDDEPFHLVRVAPLAPDAVASAGPMMCSPSRGGLEVRFLEWRVGEADVSLH